MTLREFLTGIVYAAASVPVMTIGYVLWAIAKDVWRSL